MAASPGASEEFLSWLDSMPIGEIKRASAPAAGADSKSEAEAEAKARAAAEGDAVARADQPATAVFVGFCVPYAHGPNQTCEARLRRDGTMSFVLTQAEDHAIYEVRSRFRPCSLPAAPFPVAMPPFSHR
jgi:hypothetical protein